MKTIYIRTIFIMLLVVKAASGQINGDYRTAASGNWDDISTWQMFNGNTWAAATVKPGTTNNVFIGDGFNVIANTNEACKGLIVQDFSTLTLQHNIVNSGDVSIGGTIDLGVSTLQNKGGGGSNENFSIGGSPVVLTGDIDSGSTTITIAGAIAGVVPGMSITGTGIPINTCVQAVSGFNIVLTHNATVTAVSQTFTISGTNTLKTANPSGIDGSIIQISRNFSNGASYVINAATTTPFPASTTIIAKDVTVNNPITLNSPLTVNGTLALSTGSIIATSSASLLTLGSAAIISGAGSNSYINGPLQLTIASTSPTVVTFPIGKDNSFRPLTLSITQNSATATTYKAEMFNTAPVNRTNPGTLSWVSFIRYYNIVKGTGANVTTAQITVNYDVTGIDDGVTDAANLRLAKDNGLGSWVDLGGDITSVNFTGSITPTIAFTTFGDFVLANNKGGTNLLGGQLPTVPVLVSPSNLAVNVPINTTLVWGKSSSTSTYRLVLATDPNFTNIVLNDSTIVDTTRLVGPLQNNTNYYWKINGKNPLGTGTFSTVFSYTTVISAPPLLTPVNGDLQGFTWQHFTWSAVTGALTYHFQLAKDSLFTILVVDDSALTVTTDVANPLTANVKYYWRVSCKNQTSVSAFSMVFNFVASITGINGNTNSMPISYNLYQNYPNPFNPSTIIKYDIPKAGIVTIKIYDILGKEVKTLESEFKIAGKYQVTFNASNLPSGIYIYAIKANNFSSVKKLMLVK